MDWPPRSNPARKLRSVGMTRIFVEAANACSNVDFLALDAHRLRAIVQETAERALGLKAYQENRGFAGHSQRFR